MKLLRLWQPKHPVFWLMLAFNVLSSLCAWVLRSFEMSLPLTLILAGIALGNVFFGLRCAWLLFNTDK